MLSGALCCSAPTEEQLTSATCSPGHAAGSLDQTHTPNLRVCLRLSSVFLSATASSSFLLILSLEAMRTSSWRTEFGQRDETLPPHNTGSTWGRTAEDHFESPNKSKPSCDSLRVRAREKPLSAQKGSGYYAIPEGTAEIPPAACTHTLSPLPLCC